MIYKSFPDIHPNIYYTISDYLDRKYNFNKFLRVSDSSINIRLLGPYTYDKYNNNDTLYYYGKNIHLYKSLQYKIQLDKYK